VFSERQRPNLDGDVTAGDVGSEFTGEQVGVGAGDVEVGPAFCDQGVDQLLPPVYFLDLIEQDVIASFGGKCVAEERGRSTRSTSSLLWRL